MDEGVFGAHVVDGRGAGVAHCGAQAADQLVADLRAKGGDVAAGFVAEVAAGAPLYQIDPGTFRATLSGARAQLASAEALAANARVIAEQSLQCVFQAVQFAGQRLQLHRIGPGQPLGLAAPHVGDLAAQAEDRLQAEPHLNDDGQDQEEGEIIRREGDVAQIRDGNPPQK